MPVKIQSVIDARYMRDPETGAMQQGFDGPRAEILYGLDDTHYGYATFETAGKGKENVMSVERYEHPEGFDRGQITFETYAPHGVHSVDVSNAELNEQRDAVRDIASRPMMLSFEDYHDLHMDTLHKAAEAAPSEESRQFYQDIIDKESTYEGSRQAYESYLTHVTGMRKEKIGGLPFYLNEDRPPMELDYRSPDGKIDWHTVDAIKDAQGKMRPIGFEAEAFRPGPQEEDTASMTADEFMESAMKKAREHGGWKAEDSVAARQYISDRLGQADEQHEMNTMLLESDRRVLEEENYYPEDTVSGNLPAYLENRLSSGFVGSGKTLEQAMDDEAKAHSDAVADEYRSAVYMESELNDHRGELHLDCPAKAMETVYNEFTSRELYGEISLDTMKSIRQEYFSPEYLAEREAALDRAHGKVPMETIKCSMDRTVKGANPDVTFLKLGVHGKTGDKLVCTAVPSDAVSMDLAKGSATVTLPKDTKLPLYSKPDGKDSGHTITMGQLAVGNRAYFAEHNPKKDRQAGLPSVEEPSAPQDGTQYGN